jgi:hypothetical protein
VLLSGCRDRDADRRSKETSDMAVNTAPPPTGDAGRPGTGGLVEVKPDAAAAAPAAGAVKPADAEALVKEWLRAQNEGDLAGYGKLYAQRFSGVKRVGPQRWQFNRTTWLADRGKMFGGKQTVAAANVAVRPAGASAIVTFTQTFQVGDFKDEGPKQLVLVREADRVVVAREEMLASKVAPPAVLDAALFAHVVPVDAQQGLGLVLSPAASADWAQGPARAVRRAAVARRDVQEAKLPEPLKAWKGRKVALYGPQGKVCEGAVTGLALLAEAVPHFGVVQGWNGEQGEPKLTDDQTAEEIWRLAADRGRRLVGLLDVDAGRCAGARFGRDAARSAPAVYRANPADGPLGATALAAFRALPAYQSVAKQFRADGKAGDWETYSGGKPTIITYVHPDAGTRYVLLHAEAGSGCGDFRGELWAIWQVTGPLAKPTLVLLSGAERPGEGFVPAVAVDLDGDGQPELVSPHRLLRREGKGYRTAVNLEPPFFDCPC